MQGEHSKIPSPPWRPLVRAAVRRTIAPARVKLAVALVLLSGAGLATVPPAFAKTGDALAYTPLLGAMLLAWLAGPVVALAVAPSALAGDAADGTLALLARRRIPLRRWALLRVAALAVVTGVTLVAAALPVGLTSALFAPPGARAGAFANLFAGAVHGVLFAPLVAALAFALSGLPRDVRPGASLPPRASGLLLLGALLVLDGVGAALLHGTPLGRIATLPTLLRALAQPLGPQGGHALDVLVGLPLLAAVIAALLGIVYARTPKRHGAAGLPREAGR